MAQELTDAKTEFLQPITLLATKWELFNRATPTDTKRVNNAGEVRLHDACRRVLF